MPSRPRADDERGERLDVRQRDDDRRSLRGLDVDARSPYLRPFDDVRRDADDASRRRARTPRCPRARRRRAPLVCGPSPPRDLVPGRPLPPPPKSLWPSRASSPSFACRPTGCSATRAVAGRVEADRRDAARETGSCSRRSPSFAITCGCGLFAGSSRCAGAGVIADTRLRGRAVERGQRERDDRDDRDERQQREAPSRCCGAGPGAHRDAAEPRAARGSDAARRRPSPRHPRDRNERSRVVQIVATLACNSRNRGGGSTSVHSS